MPRIVELGREFHAYSPWKDVPFDAEAFGAFASRLVDFGAVFLSDDGMCGGMVQPLYFNPAVKLGAELFWWGKGAPREEFEAWCRDEGAFGVQFSALADERLPAVSRLYRMAGFKPAETAFVKRF